MTTLLGVNPPLIEAKAEFYIYITTSLVYIYKQNFIYYITTSLVWSTFIMVFEKVRETHGVLFLELNEIMSNKLEMMGTY